LFKGRNGHQIRMDTMNNEESPPVISNILLVFSLFKCLAIPLCLYLAFSSLLSEDNFLVTHSIIVMECVIFVNSAFALLLWYNAATTSKKSRIKIWWVIKCLTCMGLMVLLLHVLIVLFGAAFTVQVNETFHLAALTASLGLWPCVFVYGLHWEALLTNIFTFEGIPFTGVEGCVNLGAKGALAGLYLGAIPIPLDWDRPWQQWPTTCVVGTLVGHVVGLSYYVLLTLLDMKKNTKRNKMI